MCRFQYEQEVQQNPLNYDTWFDYIKLEESTGDVERTREVRCGLVEHGEAGGRLVLLEHGEGGDGAWWSVGNGEEEGPAWELQPACLPGIGILSAPQTAFKYAAAGVQVGKRSRIILAPRST